MLSQVVSQERRLCLGVFAARGVAVGHGSLGWWDKERVGDQFMACDQEPDEEADNNAHHTSLK